MVLENCLASINDYTISPRQVADKFVKKSLPDAIRPTLDAESYALHINMQTFNRNRCGALQRPDDYETLKDRAREVEEESIEDLPELCSIENRLHRETGRKNNDVHGIDFEEFHAPICI